MNLQLITPVLSQLMGRDVSSEIAMLYRARGAIGAALNQHGQIFVSRYYQELPAFLESEAGQKAIQDFVTAWGTSLLPNAPSNTTPPPQQPQAQPQQQPTQQAEAQFPLPVASPVNK